MESYGSPLGHFSGLQNSLWLPPITSEHASIGSLAKISHLPRKCSHILKQNVLRDPYSFLVTFVKSFSLEFWVLIISCRKSIWCWKRNVKDTWVIISIIFRKMLIGMPTIVLQRFSFDSFSYHLPKIPFTSSPSKTCTKPRILYQPLTAYI